MTTVDQVIDEALERCMQIRPDVVAIRLENWGERAELSAKEAAARSFTGDVFVSIASTIESAIAGLIEGLENGEESPRIEDGLPID